LIGELLRRLHRVVHVARRSAALLLIEQSPRFVEVLEGAIGVGRLGSVGRRLPHRIGGILQSPSSVGEGLVLLLARQALELARLIFRLLRHVALAPAARRPGCAHAAQTVRLGARAIVLLLLALGELAELFRSLVDLIVRLLLILLATLHGLVLIAQAIL